MDETTPTGPNDPTQPNEAVTAPVEDATPVAAPAASTHRFWNRTTGTLIAVGVLGAVLGGGAVAVAAGIRDEDHHGYDHDDAGRGPEGMRGPWGQRDGGSFGPGGGMRPRSDDGQQYGPRGGMQQGGTQQFGPQGGMMQGGPSQGGTQQYGPQGGMMQGGQQQGGWGPQGMTRGS